MKIYFLLVTHTFSCELGQGGRKFSNFFPKMSLTFRCGSGKLCHAPRYGVARKESEQRLLLPPGEAIFQV